MFTLKIVGLVISTKIPTTQSPLKRYHAGYPMERVQLDVSGPPSESGNQYVLMMIDQFSKWVECNAIPEQSTETVVQ